MFLIDKNGKLIDLELDVLRDVLSFLDSTAEGVHEYGGRLDLPDPDSIVYDTIEQLDGLGLVACQTYLASTYRAFGIEKSRALRSGPQAAPGYTFAEIVNHSANYWKHQDEWALNPNQPREMSTRAALAALGCEADDYPMGSVVAALVRPKPGLLEHLVPRLEAWRDSLPVPERKPPSP